MQVVTNERLSALLQQLNDHLARLSRTIEAVVAERLAVSLEPVDLQLEKPSTASFHESLQALFDAGALHSLPLVVECGCAVHRMIVNSSNIEIDAGCTLHLRDVDNVGMRHTFAHT